MTPTQCTRSWLTQEKGLPLRGNADAACPSHPVYIGVTPIPTPGLRSMKLLCKVPFLGQAKAKWGDYSHSVNRTRSPFFLFLLFFFNFQKCPFSLSVQYRAKAWYGCFQDLIGRRGLEKQVSLAARPWPPETQGCIEEIDGSGAVGDEGWFRAQDLKKLICISGPTTERSLMLLEPTAPHLPEILHLHVTQTQSRKKIWQLIPSISFTLPQLSILDF